MPISGWLGSPVNNSKRTPLDLRHDEQEVHLVAVPVIWESDVARTLGDDDDLARTADFPFFFFRSRV